MSHTRAIRILLFLDMRCSAAHEWPAYAGDPGGTKYSALKQINRLENVTRLKVAWTFHTGEYEPTAPCIRLAAPSRRRRL